uniref:ATP synthase subunit a n=1 Tax=Athripsodes aterrimus TaxID=699862 RepID=A0A7D7AG83_9NEOP|nr:ATP synthase F0 subunit 6 [Athripsodes aterrimus]
MMTNLFSIFDPSTNILNINFNWLSIILGILFLYNSFWIIPSRLMMIYKLIMKSLFNEFKMLMNIYTYNGNILIFITLFFYILYNNLLGLMPYIFTATTHMALTLSLSMSIWLTLMIFGWMNKYTHMMAHMIPNGTPIMLTWFMVLIETTSNIIRPMTLAIRLMANMMAGHLLITLLSELFNKVNYLIMTIIIFTQILLLILEISVAFIQSYVFFILSTLYTTEI